MVITADFIGTDEGAAVSAAPLTLCADYSGAARGTNSRVDFARRKEQILATLDRSPKGSLDAPILDFLGWLNAQPNLVTTSSCSGRIAVFLGNADPSCAKGGKWLVSSHGPIDDSAIAWKSVVTGVEPCDKDSEALQGTLATFMMEPFLLHAECADAATAQCVLEMARETGFRESGLSLGRRRIMVQLRTNAARLEVPLAADGKMLVALPYFEFLVKTANERMADNVRRIARLWGRLREALAPAMGAAPLQGLPWILSCPSSLARAVKLALEDLGLMDDERKLAQLPPSNGQPPRMGIPITEAAADYFEDLEVSTEAREEALVAANGAHASVDQAHDAMGTEAKTKKRPPTTACDLPELWRTSGGPGGSLSLLRSDDLPRKQRPPQRGGGAGGTGVVGAVHGEAKSKEKDAIVNALEQVYASVNGTGCPLPDFISEARSMGSVQWREDVALLPRGGLSGDNWESLEAETGGRLWETLRGAIGARLLVRQQEILVDSGVRAGAVQILAGTGDGWVVVPGPRGVRYTFDVTKCMFSEGNAAEKVRVSEWNVCGETILDMYTGIGFWSLPLLAAGAGHVFSCEWNPDALEGFRRGLKLLSEDLAGRCTVLAGDNRRAEVTAASAGRCDRVLLGLIPFSRDGFPNAVAALRDCGGTLHVHWNAPSEEEASVAAAVAQELQAMFCAQRGEGWTCAVTHVQRIKWYAPRVRHLRIDIRCSPQAA